MTYYEGILDKVEAWGRRAASAIVNEDAAGWSDEVLAVRGTYKGDEVLCVRRDVISEVIGEELQQALIETRAGADHRMCQLGDTAAPVFVVHIDRLRRLATHVDDLIEQPIPAGRAQVA